MNVLRAFLFVSSAFLVFACAQKPVAVPLDFNVLIAQHEAPLKEEIRNLNRGLQRLSKESKSIEFERDKAIVERDALAAKIKAYFALNCLCKHKDILK